MIDRLTCTHKTHKHAHAYTQEEGEKDSNQDPAFVKALLALHDKFVAVVDQQVKHTHTRLNTHFTTHSNTLSYCHTHTHTHCDTHTVRAEPAVS